MKTYNHFKICFVASLSSFPSPPYGHVLPSVYVCTLLNTVVSVKQISLQTQVQNALQPTSLEISQRMAVIAQQLEGLKGNINMSCELLRAFIKVRGTAGVAFRFCCCCRAITHYGLWYVCRLSRNLRCGVFLREYRKMFFDSCLVFIEFFHPYGVSDRLACSSCFTFLESPPPSPPPPRVRHS